MPKRIQRKRTKGWRMPDNAVYVGRGSRWGNPYPANEHGHQWAVEQFREHAAFTDSEMRALRGRDLACWCPLNMPCHADVLLGWASVYWYTAEEIVLSVAEGLTVSVGEAARWLGEGVKFLPDAAADGDLERCLEEPTSSIDLRWDTLIAGSIRHTLRRMGFDAADMPTWTWKPPLPEIWSPGAYTPRMRHRSFIRTPPEIRRLGIIFAADNIET